MGKRRRGGLSGPASEHAHRLGVAREYKKQKLVSKVKYKTSLHSKITLKRVENPLPRKPQSGSKRKIKSANLQPSDLMSREKQCVGVRSGHTDLSQDPSILE